MIVVDIETSDVFFVEGGIFQIGAVEFENPENQFFEDCRIDDEDRIAKESLFVTGKTKEEVRDKSKQSQKELLEKFFEWCKKIKVKNFICQNPQFDVGFFFVKARKYGLEISFHYRAFDLHSIAHLNYFQEKREFLIKEDHSEMGLSNILPFCGMRDERTVHNALEDAKLTAEAFSRLLYGKGIFEEFKKFPIPEYLKK